MRSQYPAAVQAIRDKILRENLKQGTRLPSTKVLADELLFNQAAIVRACNVLISGGTLFREGYKLRVGSNGSSSSKVPGVIDVVSYEDVGRGIARLLEEQGINYRLTELSWRKQPSPDPVLEKIFARKPAGVIFWTSALDPSTISLLEAQKIPMVICADGYHLPKWSSVRTDAYRGAEQAIQHLYELGHRQIAHVALCRSTADEEKAECFRTMCLKLNLRSSSSRIWKAEVVEATAVQNTVSAGLKRHPGVTAVFCDDQAGVWITERFAVPQKLSVVGFGAGAATMESHPPLTTVGNLDGSCIVSWACMEMISQLRIEQSGRPAKPPTQAVFIPGLIVRKSTQALNEQNVVPEITSNPPLPKSDPEASWQNAYPFLKKNSSDNWLQLDLSKLANHSITRQHGWLGAEPLEHFPPGLRFIHGVPFHVLNEDNNDGRAVVTFRSPHSHSASKKLLPTRIEVKLNSRVKALYFLHGCGYAKPIRFADYIMHDKTGGLSRVPLIPLGPARRMALDQLGDMKPNLQDWWRHPYEHVDFPHAHHVTVFDPADPKAYQRSLYSLEWINPQPQNEIRSIEVRVDATAGPALALIAISALL